MSLRKMPHGRFVAFDYRSRTPHKCRTRKTKKKTSPTKKSKVDTEVIGFDSNISSPKNSASNVQRVLMIITNNPGINAREIADQLGIERNDANSILFGDLSEKVEQDRHFGWRIKSDQHVGDTSETASYTSSDTDGDSCIKWIGYGIGLIILYKLLIG